MKHIAKFIISIIVIALLTSFLCTKTYAAEDSNLRGYFQKAISLFENEKYEDAIRILEEIIKIEKSEGQYYFTPFSEIYIAKAKSKNIQLISKDIGVAKLKNEKVPKKLQEVEGKAGSRKKVEHRVNAAGETYESMINYHEKTRKRDRMRAALDTEENERHKITEIAEQDTEEKNEHIKTYPNATQQKPRDLEKEEIVRESKVHDKSGWTRPKIKEPKVYREREWTRLGGRAKIRQAGRPIKADIREDRSNTKIADLRNNPDFKKLLYKRIDSGLENLDESTLKLFNDQRFRAIVRLIRKHKLRNRRRQ